MKFLNERCRLLNPWPPNSPDFFKTIKNLWEIIDKRLLGQKCGDIEVFKQIIKDVFFILDWITLESLVISMEKRINLVIV